MRIKKLVGKKCYLSPIDAEDAEQYTIWLNDLEVVDFLQLSTASISVEGEKEVLRGMAKKHVYGIVDLDTNTLIGNIGFADLDQIHRRSEVGIFIGDKTFWNRGYGSEALTLLLDYGFKELNLHSVGLKTYSFNPRGVACYEKVGFKKCGIMRDAIRRNRAYHDIILMDILEDEFYAPVTSVPKNV